MNIKLLIGISCILIFLLLLNCTSFKKNDCEQFNVGSFEYRSNGLLYTITREDTLQTEVNKANGDVTKNSVRWITNCSYQLRLLESTAVYPDSIAKLRRASTLTVTILSWTDTYYIYKSESNVVDRVVMDTLWIRSR